MCFSSLTLMIHSHTKLICNLFLTLYRVHLGFLGMIFKLERQSEVRKWSNKVEIKVNIGIFKASRTHRQDL